MTKKILVFDSHPVQYRVPIWQAMEAAQPGAVHVVYASDCSVKGHVDVEFGRTVAWDEPMLDGYQFTILGAENGIPLSGWGSLTGKGIKETIEKITPDVILLTGLNYKYDLVAFEQAKLKGIPVWLRCETQDQAVNRSWYKGLVRSFIYTAAYVAINRMFYIGKLNRKHYIGHGVPASKLIPAHYCTVDRFKTMTEVQKKDVREKTRQLAQVGETEIVIGFSGKLIGKKNPDILFRMLAHLPQQVRARIYLYFVGSGELEEALRKEAATALSMYGIKTYFSGFVNQSEIGAHYLAMDIMVLPSRRMGETWGLVVNEAMQAGAGVIVSDAVGSSADFEAWERFRVFPEGEEEELARQIADLAVYPRNFGWAETQLEAYTIEAAANAFLNELNKK